jgi:hypothetical protein
MSRYATDGKCHNANRGTFGHECGKPATWIGTKRSGFRSGFCSMCKEIGDEARDVIAWKPVRTQARFWTYQTGAVRIKIRAGQVLRHSSGGPTDEGYSWEAVEYTFDGATVTAQWAVDARDCDGRITRNSATQCAADRLTAGYHDEEEGLRFPDWQGGLSEQRDYAAEAAGY